MPDPIFGVIASSFTATKNLVEFGLHWKEVTPETKNFLINIRQVDEKINTARRLRRQKSDLLDVHTKREVDSDIETADEVLKAIGKTIECNRVDIDLNDSVGTWNRVKWLMRGHSGFLSHQTILNASLQSLICSIARLTAVQRPDFNPPTYEQASEFQGSLRPPSARRKASSVRLNKAYGYEEDMRKVQSQPVTTQEKYNAEQREPMTTQEIYHAALWEKVAHPPARNPHDNFAELEGEPVPWMGESNWERNAAEQGENGSGNPRRRSEDSLTGFRSDPAPVRRRRRGGAFR